jgi:hypothetical protein
MTNAMGAVPFTALMIVHQVQVAGVPVLEAEYQPVVAGDLPDAALIDALRAKRAPFSAHLAVFLIASDPQHLGIM